MLGKKPTLLYYVVLLVNTIYIPMVIFQGGKEGISSSPQFSSFESRLFKVNKLFQLIIQVNNCPSNYSK